MQEAILMKDASVLTPNKEHQNFTATDEIIPAGTKVCGSVKIVKGKRKGQDFSYKLFLTDTGKFIYLNKIKPVQMETTEVTLGADAQPSSTVVKVPNKGKMNPTEIVSTLVGASIGFAYCKYKKHDTKRIIVYAVVGGVAGFLAGRYVVNPILHTRRGVVVKESK